VSSLQPHSHGCSQPQLSELLTDYCFGAASESDREAVQQHLLECDICWTAVRRLYSAVEALRLDPELPALPITAETIGVMSTSGELDLPFAGHPVFVVAMSFAYASLYAASVWTELSFAFDRFGSLTMVLSGAVLLGCAVAVAATLGVLANMTRVGRSAALPFAIAFHVGTIVLILALLAVWLPPEPTIRATFTTRSAFGGYLKNVVFYFLPLGLVYVLWPFHTVVALQRELLEGRWANTLKLLSSVQPTVMPRGVWFVQPQVLGWLLLPAIAIGVAGTQYMLDSLMPGPYANLYTISLYMRVGLWFVAALLGLFWYTSNINELKREAVALERLSMR